MAFRRSRKRRRGFQRVQRKVSLFSNRRNPKSRWVTFEDVRLNLYERIYGWWNRVPKDATLRWKSGRITGYSTKNRWP
jgi:hypothetical protein